MKLFLFILFTSNSLFIMAQKDSSDVKLNKLTEFEKYVIIYKRTEKPYSGKYEDFNDPGTYVCKQCDAPLYRSDDKFNSHCGWPSFDDEIKDAVKHIPDADGRRTEIVCAKCGAHLGHIFLNEGYTQKNRRHCVNSVSLKFIPEKVPEDINH